MSKSVLNIMFAALAGLFALAAVIQGFKINSLKDEINTYKNKAEGIEIALRNSEDENKRLRELIVRANNALDEGLKQIEEAKKRYDERNEKIDDAPTDWLQCPLPDEVREAFGAYCYSDAGSEATDSSTRAM